MRGSKSHVWKVIVWTRNWGGAYVVYFEEKWKAEAFAKKSRMRTLVPYQIMLADCKPASKR